MGGDWSGCSCLVAGGTGVPPVRAATGGTPVPPATPARPFTSEAAGPSARRRTEQNDLPLSGVVDGLAKDAGSLLRRVEAERILRQDEVDPTCVTAIMGTAARSCVR